MRELKAHRIIGLDEQCASVDNDYYLKSEVDKVIAEKDAAIAELKEQVHDYAQGLYVMQARAEMELRRSNRKRCLAMAECRDAQARLFHRFGTEVMLNQLYGRNPAVDMERMDRRSSRCRLASQLWKKRAEEFKEAK